MYDFVCTNCGNECHSSDNFIHDRQIACPTCIKLFDNPYCIDWGTTFTGKRFYYREPRPEDVCIKDIAHALSQICRWNGHSSIFYSVAQHSVLCAEYLKRTGASKLTQLYALLHDAHEAYICDLQSPFKRLLKEYQPIAERIQRTIWMHCGLPEIDRCSEWSVAHADNMLLRLEAHTMLKDASWCEAPERMDISIDMWQICEAEDRFIEDFIGLIGD